ncbi:MAG: hypothetical protein CBB69_004420 [Phycisphaera sp. TMED9]|nr:MAG: hypothetical protein CBB69_004420 [Phycisphaera sp. TMED9]
MTAADGYRTSAISLVHRQFEFAGTDVIRRHLSELLKLYPEVDPSRSYPLSWFVFRITGVAAEDESDEDLVISGTDLLADASLLIDRLASRLGPEPFDPELDVTADDVALRLGVSRRTVQRWKPFGLPMWLARSSNGGARSVCRILIVDAFIARNESRIEKAGRAREDRVSKKTAGLESPRAVRSQADRARIARLIGRGQQWLIPLVELQDRVDRSRPVVRRLALQARVDHLGVVERPTFVPPNLDRPDASEVFGVAGSLDGDADEQSRRSLTEVLETVRGSLGAEDEEIVRSRIAAMHFARARAHEGLEAVQARTGAVREHDIDRVESDLRWWGMLLERATISGLGPGVQRFEQSIGRRIEQLPVKRIDDAMTLVIDGVSEAVQSFDPTRRTQGHNLDRSVGLTVSRRVARSSAWAEIKGARRRSMPESPGEISMLRCIPAPVRSLLAPVRWWRMLDGSARAEMEASPGFEKFAIRYGLQTPGRPRSLLETGRVIGVPSTRWSGEVQLLVRDLRRRAVSSLRRPIDRE